MNRPENKVMDWSKKNHELAFLVFMVLVAALSGQNSSFTYPEILWSFLAISVFNLGSLVFLEKRLPPETAALVAVAANILLIALILDFSGGQDSYFWVLFLLPIFTASLSLAKPAVFAAIAAAVFILGFFHHFGGRADWSDLLEWASKSATLIVCGSVTLAAAGGERAAKSALKREQARVELERQELAVKLQHTDRLATVGTLVASVAHDINNPLTTILSVVSLHRSACGPPEELRRDLGMLEDAAKRCQQIVQNLLAFSRKQKASPELLDVNRLLRQCVAFKKYDWIQQDIEVAEEYEEGTPGVELVGPQFQQVIFNLLVNAQQALQASRGRGRIWVRTRRLDKFLRIVVEDDGPGISPELAGAIFEPFFTTKPVGVGTGLGLSICKQLVEELGGTISVHSSPGKGASFSIDLPLRAKGEAGPLEAKAPPPAARGRPPKVLIAEDEAAIAAILVRILRPLGLSIAVVKSFDEALLEIRKETPDLLLTDLKMPGLEAAEFFRILDLEGRLKGLRVIAVSGSLVGTSLENLIHERKIPRIDKPFEIGELAGTVQRLLGIRPEAADLRRHGKASLP